MREVMTGSWRLVSFRATNAAGQVTEPLGRNPFGLGVYTAEGVVSAQLARVDGTGFLAYAGRYEVDADADVVAHHVMASSRREWIGTVLRRRFSFDGNEVVLRPVEDDFGDAELRWTAVRW